LTRIEGNTFSHTWLTAIIIPPSTESIGNKCFLNSERLQSVIFDPGLWLCHLGHDAFTGTLVSPVLPVKHTDTVVRMALSKCPIRKPFNSMHSLGLDSPFRNWCDN
jgi:hypothetical protein